METTIEVGFGYCADKLNLDDISMRLNLIPTRCFKAGDPIKADDILVKGISEERKQEFIEFQKSHEDSYKACSRVSRWAIYMREKETLNLNDQLSELKDFLKDKIAEINEINILYNINPDIIIIIREYHDQSPVIYFDAHVVNFISSINANIDMDIGRYDG